MTVELISVGTELLLGNTVNTNATYLSQQCAKFGLSLYYQTVVGDNEDRLREVLEQALIRSDIVILTGGLGPTQDDLTKEVTAKVLKRKLIEDKRVKKQIEHYLNHNIYKTIPKNNWKQAMIIENCIVVDNKNGTAPGLIVETEEKKKVILLPGPPHELYPMFEQKIAVYLARLQSDFFYSKMVKLTGIGESEVETIIQDLIDTQTNPTIATYAKIGEVDLRVTASATTKEEAKTLVNGIVKELKKRFQENIFTTKESITLEDTVIALLKNQKLTVATAESCTGGLCAARLINVSGASEVFKEGFITYSNKAKKNSLKVSKKILKEWGAVSAKTAKEMAKGAALATGSDTAISITGIAGPTGGTKKKRVGLVYIGCYVKGIITVKEFLFKGDRDKIREFSVVYALDFLRRSILSQN